MRLVLSFLLLACKKDPPSEAVGPALKPVPPAVAREGGPEEPAPAASAPAGVDAMLQALSARDRGPSCAEVEGLSPAPVEALLHIVEEVPLPPQAPMRAAACLVDRHPEEVREQLLAWVKREGTEGLGRLVLQRLDTLPEPIAVDVARVAVTGPLASEAVEAARSSKREAVRAAAAAPGGGGAHRP